MNRKYRWHWNVVSLLAPCLLNLLMYTTTITSCCGASTAEVQFRHLHQPLAKKTYQNANHIHPKNKHKQVSTQLVHRITRHHRYSNVRLDRTNIRLARIHFGEAMRDISDNCYDCALEELKTAHELDPSNTKYLHKIRQIEKLIKHWEVQPDENDSSYGVHTSHYAPSYHPIANTLVPIYLVSDRYEKNEYLILFEIYTGTKDPEKIADAIIDKYGIDNISIHEVIMNGTPSLTHMIFAGPYVSKLLALKAARRLIQLGFRSLKPPDYSNNVGYDKRYTIEVLYLDSN